MSKLTSKNKSEDLNELQQTMFIVSVISICKESFENTKNFGVEVKVTCIRFKSILNELYFISNDCVLSYNLRKKNFSSSVPTDDDEERK